MVWEVLGVLQEMLPFAVLILLRTRGAQGTVAREFHPKERRSHLLSQLMFSAVGLVDPLKAVWE